MADEQQADSVDLGAEINELVTRTRSQDQLLDMYGGKRANGGKPAETQASEPASGLDSSQGITNLIDTGRRHTEAICSMVEGVLDEIEKLVREQRTELREMKRQRIQADSALVKTAHKIMTTAPQLKTQLTELASAIRASGE